MRIAIAGWQHETNTFSPIKTTFDHFLQTDNWPGLSTGKEILARFNQTNIPISGFIARANYKDLELVPLLWCSAVPSGVVTTHAFNAILTRLLTALDQCGDVDAIYLDLHGAMVSEEYEDADGEILRAIRAKVGARIPILVSLDLHANVSALMLEQASVVIAYQTYPHIDMAETGAKLVDCIADARHYKMLSKSFSFIAPVTSQCTLIEPADTVYRKLQQLESDCAVKLSFTQGFPLADTRDTAPCVFGYGLDEGVLKKCMDELSQCINDSKKLFQSKLFLPLDAIEHVNDRIKDTSKPFIFADTQDNPGCGGVGNTKGILREMVQQVIPESIVAMLFEPVIAAAAHTAGIGKMIELSLDDKAAVVALATVVALGNGDLIGQGPFYQGAHMQLGKMALLDVAGVEVIVASANVQAADRAIFQHLGVDFKAKKIIVLKSSVHFRADFQTIAEDILLVTSPGLNSADLNQLEYVNIDPNMELL